ncbi:MAG: hypothetical protein IAB76_02825 [Bacteroidetes bacterium]|uniref:Uncharacterized protein n=1 Tax=Candidatus Cryptobacteroides avistercoris TaxID=2840758 RepID=A0A9D9IW35_9BACT|nr:hypothetical protein [Candidatus Cryptobacteroides avistercoris]
MDTSILDNLGNLGNLDNLVNLESLGSPSPGLITGLVLVASVLGLVLAIALIVFCIFYLFKFDALKDWVNDLADGEEIVEHRLSFSMLRPILATFVITGGCLAVAVLAPETYWLIAAVPLLYWAVVLGIRGRKLGTRAAFCEMIYLAFATAAALSLITVFIWLLLIYAAILLLGYLTSGSGSSSSSSSADDDDARDESVDTSRCCGTCLHHGTANCPASGPDPDYYSGPCGSYQHYKGYL